MSRVPREVLSKAIGDVIAGRRVLAAVFLTFEFDPAFFEAEVLPVLFDEAYSHEEAVKMLQVEDAMRSLAAPVAVYYDRNGLRPNRGGSRLEIQRVPVHYPTGIFHPKNLVVLVEGDPDEDGQRPQALLVATSSANLTRNGWWENVECCHLEEIRAGSKTWLKIPMQRLLRRVRDHAPAQDGHPAIDRLLEFLGAAAARERSSAGERQLAFWSGANSLVDFLREELGDEVRGWHLEVLSPFFDEHPPCHPLQNLIDAFAPAAVRVLLPMDGEAATCSSAMAKAIGAMPGVEWGELPGDLLSLGKAADAGTRRVHAKVYRFFRTSPRREILFLGSPNLTRAAFQRGGNWETGVLVELAPSRAPEPWLAARKREPSSFVHEGEDGEAATSLGSPLQLRYRWDREQAEAFWDAATISGRLRVLASGVLVGEIDPLPPAEWIVLPATFARSLAAHLVSTSLLQAAAVGDEPRFVLVQEEGMARRPSLLQSLSVADILRCWSLLTQEQRNAFLEERGQLLVVQGGLHPQLLSPATNDSLFDRFAGIFHAFGSLERSVRAALADPKHPGRDAESRLFGCKHDSLGHLLDRALADEQTDDLSRYLLWLCAEQTWRTLREEFSDYFAERLHLAKSVEERLARIGELRQRVAAKESGMPEFLAWFEPHFRRRVEPTEAT